MSIRCIKGVVRYAQSSPCRFSSRFVLLVLIIITFVMCAAARDLTLRFVRIPNAPIINKGKKIVYVLELVFDNNPRDYWIVYNSRKKKLVVDFYGTHIKGKSKADLPRSGIFKDIKIVNRRTKLALSGKNSNILIGIKPEPAGWHFKSVTTSKNVIRITAWKDMNFSTKKVEKNKRSLPLLYICIAGLVSLVTFGTILIIGSID